MYFTALISYFILLVVIGLSLSKKKPDFEHYFFGNRKVGKFLILFTITASWFGAAATIETVNASHKSGFNSIWLLGIPTILTLLIFLIIHKRIRSIHFVSLPALLQSYYGDLVSKIASFLIYFYMVVLAASQLVAWGLFTGHFLGQNYQSTIIAGALIIIIYSYLGGYLSVIITDGLQLFLLVGAILYMIIFFSRFPLPIKPADLNLMANLEGNALMVLSFVLAWTISPIIWQRIASARSAKASKFGLLSSIGVFTVLYILVILIGIFLRNFAPSVDRFASILGNSLPPAGSIIVFLGIAAAIMSTTDTALNIGALTLINDVFLHRGKNRMLYAKLATLLSGILAVSVAMRFRSIIKTLGLASEIMAEGLFLPGIYALLFRKRRPNAALMSLILGGGFSILSFFNAFGLPLNLPRWPFTLPLGLSLSTLGFAVGLIMDKKQAKF